MSLVTRNPPIKRKAVEDITSENNLPEEAIQQHQEPQDNTKLGHYLERLKRIKRNKAKNFL